MRQMAFLSAKLRVIGKWLKDQWLTSLLILTVLCVAYLPLFKLFLDRPVNGFLLFGFFASLSLGFCAYLSMAYILGLTFALSPKMLLRHFACLLLGITSPVCIFSWLALFCRGDFNIHNV